MPRSTQRKLQAGVTISRAFELFFGGFGTWMGIAGACAVVVVAIGLLFELAGIPVSAALDTEFDPEAQPGFDRMELVGSAVYNILALVFAQLVAGASCAAAAAMREGRPVTMGESLGIAIKRFFPILGLALLTGLVIGFTLFLCLLGLFFFTMWYVAVPALVLENRGVVESMDRSAVLTRGTRWQVFLVVVVFFLVGVVIGGVVMGLLVFASPVVAIPMTILVTMLSNSLGSVASIVTYLDLVELKESRRDIAEVFD